MKGAFEVYIIVNSASNRPIFAIGFCSSYTNREEAEKTAEIWNKRKSPSKCKVQVIERG